MCSQHVTVKQKWRLNNEICDNFSLTHLIFCSFTKDIHFDLEILISNYVLDEN